MQTYFYRLADYLTSLLRADEVFTSSFAAEDSEFVRFNHAAVRQAGAVHQRSLGLDLIQGSRHAPGEICLSGDAEEDRERVATLLQDLRHRLPQLPEDPHLLYATEVRSSERHGKNELPVAEESVRSILEAAEGLDLVGIYAAGGIHTGFANSFGQRNWFSTFSYNFDWSLYHQADKAVKSSYAGFAWDAAEFQRKMAHARQELAILSRPARTIEPGRYRVYLSPVALYEILGLLAWGGFGLKDHRTKQTPFLRMIEEGARLKSTVSLYENTAEGVSAGFQAAGFMKPNRVTLIEKGAYRECLVSPRSAREYGVPTNGAADFEMPVSLEMAAGDLPRAEVLQRLDTGVYVNNLWYLNYSDRPACRMTGMTRFATFWVENGAIQAPLNVMRFDETLYRALGENLVGLTAEREFLLDPETYHRRSTASARLPGALLREFNFTL